ncbi:MAG: VanZ family protein [Bacteroidetes bacterium]|nr:VanZ family protein [Bacteroidota bacterium]
MISEFIFKKSVWLAVIWTIVIFILCATPGQYIPSASWLELLSFDKWVHASVFFILASLLITVSLKYKQGNAIVCFYLSLCILYGGLLEIMQAKCFSNRSADWQDFAANTFGVLVALACIKKFRQAYLPFSSGVS